MYVTVMNTLASSTSGTTIINGSRQRFQTSRMMIASTAVTAIFTIVAARLDPRADSVSSVAVRVSTNHSATDWSRA